MLHPASDADRSVWLHRARAYEVLSDAPDTVTGEELCKFRMKGNLFPPTIIGLFAVAIGAVTLLSPHRADVSVAIWGVLAGLFGVYVLCGVVISWRARR